MKKLQFSLLTVLGTLGATCGAQDLATNTPAATVDYPEYRSQEISFDAFGTGSLGEKTIDHLSGDRVKHNGRLGAGGGINYFFCRYVGIGADAYTEDVNHSFIDSTSGNLIVRFPIADTGIAPYAFGGGGYKFDDVAEGFADAGGGIEFRFCRHVGAFVDARYVFPDKTENYGVGRVGLRFNF